MSKEYSVRVLDQSEYEAWDELVEASPAGTAYNTSWWVGTQARQNGARMEVIGCFAGDALCGGCAAYIRQRGPLRRVGFPPTTPYNGFVIRPPATPNQRRQLLYYLAVSEEIAAFMETRYDEIQLRHHFEFMDIRSITWRGWSSDVYYTYVMSVVPFAEALARCSSSIKRAVNRARASGVVIYESDDIEAFLPLYEQTYGKQGLEIPLSPSGLTELFQTARRHESAHLYLTRHPEGAIMSGLVHLTSGSQANTWVLASNPEYLKEGVATCAQLYGFSRTDGGLLYVDDASANIENLHHNAIRLGGELRPIFGTRYCRSGLLEAVSSALGWAKGKRRQLGGGS